MKRLQDFKSFLVFSEPQYNVVESKVGNEVSGELFWSYCIINWEVTTGVCGKKVIQPFISESAGLGDWKVTWRKMQ